MAKPYQAVSLDDSRRMAHTALRRRMLEGCWEDDLVAYIGEHIDPARQAAWGRPSKAVNLLRAVVGQLSVLYDELPRVTHPQVSDLSALADVFHLHQRHEDFVLALRDSLIRVSWSSEDHLNGGGLSFRLVTGDRVVVDAFDESSGVPARIYERRMRENPLTRQSEAFWDVWDVTDASAPSFRIMSEGASAKDMTAHFAPEWVDSYPYVDGRGRPFLPFVMYHARDTGRVWDSYTWDELPDATLAVGLYYTFFNHAVKDASWVQKYGLNVELQGSNAVGDGDETRSRVSTDPATILLFRTRSGETGSLGSFPLPAKPTDLIDAIRTFQILVCEGMGIGKWDAQEIKSQSGAAIQIRKDQVRELTAKTEPQFRRGDEELLRKCALIHNLFSGGPALPEDGYQIAYTGVPLTREELTLGLDRNLKLLAQGLLSRVDLLMDMHPGMTRPEAFARLLEIQDEERALERLSAPSVVEGPQAPAIVPGEGGTGQGGPQSV